MLNKNFANPKSKAPLRKLSPEDWYKQQMAAGLLPAEAMDEAKMQELFKAGKYISFYDPSKTSKDEKGGLINKDGTTENVFIDYQYKAPKAPVIESKPAVTPTGAGIEVGPYQTIDKNTGKTYHTGTDIEVKPQVYMGGKLVEEKAKGGMVKRYDLGGTITKNKDATSAVAGGLGQVAMMGGAALDASNEVDEFGQINENKAAGATALKWGGTAAGIAANPALLAATGGLSLLAIPAAAGVGAIVGARKAGKENDLASQRIKEEQDAIKKQQSQSRVEEAIRQRELGLAKGGKVVGAGTGTSDSIKAKVEEGSFIVPAKNAKLAEEIREKVLRTPPKRKATLMEDGGEVVKLSNGEHKFTPEEAMKIEIELGPEIFKRLAPEAEDNEVEDDDESEMASGGRVSIAKAKEILKDGTAHGKPLTDKQKGYFGWLAGGGMKCGGKVKGYGGGGEVTEDKTPYNKAAYPLKNEGDSTMYKMGYDDWKAGDLTNHTDAYNKAFNGKNDIRAKIYVDGFLRSVQEENAAKVELQRKIDEEKRRQSASKPQLTNQQVIDLSKKLAATAAPNPFEEADVPNLSSLNKYDLERVMKMFKRDYPNLPAPQAMEKGGRVAPMKGYAKGGFTTGGDEEKMIAEERKKLAEYEAKLAKLQKDTDAARAKAETDKKRGEERSDIIDGLEKRMSDLRSAQKELAKAKAEFNAIDSSLKTYRSQVSSARNAPLSAGEKAGLKGSARPADDDILKNTKKLIGELEGKRKMIESAQKKIDYASDEKNYIPQTATAKTVKPATESGGGIDWLSGNKPKEATAPKTTPAPSTTPTETKVAATKVAPKRTASKPIVTAPTDQTAALTNKILGEDTYESDLADLKRYETPTAPQSGLAAKAVGEPTPSAVTSQGGNANAAANEVSNTGNKLSGTDLQGLIGYGVPLAQAAIGWNQLQKQGKRPVDKLDPDFLSRIDAAKARALTAEKEAMYGMTPEEKFLLNQQSQGLANQQRNTARNQFASGSGGTALGLERMAINDAYGRGLMTKVQDKNLQLQKQAIAADRASTVDQLVGLKTEMNRRLFADEMNAWQQNQMAAGDLTSQGLTNLMAQNRYNQFLKNRQLEA